MSKHWTPPVRKAVNVRPSRIRRDPARVSRIRRDPLPIAETRKVVRRSDKAETWFGVAGVLFFAAAIAAATTGIAWATYFKQDPAAAASDAQFGQCYNSDPTKCVVDGDTIYFNNARVQIAGIEAPSIQDAACAAESSRGIDAAMRLQGLLNRGKVTVGPTFTDEYGRSVSKVLVDGDDVADKMLSTSAAREYTGEKQKWCSGS